MVDIENIDSLKSLVDEIKAKNGDDISVVALTLVVKVGGWDTKAFGFENGCVYEL